MLEPVSPSRHPVDGHLSEMLRGMARRASKLRREVREECAGRYWAEQFARYASPDLRAAYLLQMQEAWIACDSIPPIPDGEAVARFYDELRSRVDTRLESRVGTSGGRHA